MPEIPSRQALADCMRLHSGQQRVYRGAASESNISGGKALGARDLNPGGAVTGFLQALPVAFRLFRH